RRLTPTWRTPGRSPPGPPPASSTCGRSGSTNVTCRPPHRISGGVSSRGSAPQVEGRLCSPDQWGGITRTVGGGVDGQGVQLMYRGSCPPPSTEWIDLLIPGADLVQVGCAEQCQHRQVRFRVPAV